MKKRLSGGIIALIVVLAIVIIAVVACVSIYNGLASAEVSVDEKYHEIETQLQRRMDLVPNLVNTVKGFAEHETEVLQNVTYARTKLAGAQTPAEQAEADSELSSALSRLLVVVENYPELKSNENFIALQDELAGTENRISRARSEYNEAVAEFNSKIVKFPSNLIAGMFGFEKAEYFEADSAANKVPEVSFD